MTPAARVCLAPTLGLALSLMTGAAAAAGRVRADGPERRALDYLAREEQMLIQKE